MADACDAAVPPTQLAAVEELARSCAKALPGGGTRLQAARVVDAADLTLPSGGLMPQQLREVLISEASEFGGGRERLIHWTTAVDFGQRDRGNHLGTDARRADGCGGDQPVRGTGSDCQEGRFIRGSGFGGTVQRTFRCWSEVGWIMAWLSSHGRFPTCDLVRTVAPDVHDDDLIVVLA